MKSHIHVVSFDVPFPADYGGVIDVFYKIQSLVHLGVGVTLHCYQYGRAQSEELERLCDRVYYYPRITGWTSAWNREPYIVYSRRSSQLLSHLLEDEDPILFEGLHTCHFLAHPALASRHRIVRMCNIEHEYYHYLSLGASSLFHKVFFSTESQRLKSFEKILSSAHHILAITPREREYFAEHYPKAQSLWVSGFHGDALVHGLSGRGEYFLFHGNLSVTENRLAVERLLPLAPSFPLPLVVAGRNPSSALTQSIRNTPNVCLEADISGDRMEDLITNAMAHILLTQQPTGLKLKLLNALYLGRYVVANREMVYGTGLEAVVCMVRDDAELITQVQRIASRDFTDTEREHRRTILSPRYDDAYNAELIRQIL